MKARQTGLPMRTTRTVLAAVLVAGLTPWGGVAVADEYTGDPSDGISVQSTSDATFYGSTRAQQSDDENGYPFYDESGNLVMGTTGVSIYQATCSGDTLYLPKTFDIVTQGRDGSQSVETVDLASVKYLDFTASAGYGYDNAFSNVKHLVVEDASSLTTISVHGLPSLQSIDVRGTTDSLYLLVSGCQNLSSLKAQDGRLGYFNMVDCPELTLNEVSASVSKGLKTLTVQQASGKIDFDASMFPDLESLGIYDSPLASWSLQGCAGLQSVIFSQCGLTSIDVDKIPQSVTKFSCPSNRIVDTSKIAARFGEDSVARQFQPSMRFVGLRAISDAVASGWLMAGSSQDIDLRSTYMPHTGEESSWTREDMTQRFATGNFTVESENPSVVSCRLASNSDGTARMTLSGVSAGTATVKVGYRFEGRYGTYEGVQEIPVTISGQSNAIASIDMQDSISLDAITDCAICDSAGVKHEEGYNQVADVFAVPSDGSRSLTADQGLQVYSSNESVVQASVSDLDGTSPYSSLSVRAVKPGDATLTIVATVNGNPTGVRKTVSVHVGQQANPVLDVAPTATVSELTHAAKVMGSSVGDGASLALASYEHNGALESLGRVHGNMDYDSCTTYQPVRVDFVTATSDNEDVLSISNGWYYPKKPGTANVTIKDVWGNEKTCKVTVKGANDILSKLSLTQREVTVAQGQQVDLREFIGGYDLLTDAEKSALGPLAFVSGDTSRVVFKCDTSWNGAGSILGATWMTARGVGDVTVKLCYSQSGLDKYDYYEGNWTPVEIGSMTVHVAEPAGQVPVSVPSARALTYNGSEQVGIAETGDYAVSAGKATDAGEYTATLSLRDKEGHVWASTGKSDDVTVKWSIASASMGEVNVSGIDESYTFTGDAIEPAVKCSFNGKTLVRGKDYTLSFADNVNAGTAKVTISGKGNFSGSVEKTFSINKVYASGAWKQSSGRWWYDNGDGTYPHDCWQMIGGSRYYFDAAGYMVTGWQQVDGEWYYLDASGAMATGWRALSGSWYWFDASGVMATGWYRVGDAWYFANDSGAMATGWLRLGGSWYYLDASGAMATGWRTIGGSWYWFDASGVMATGWQRVGNSWYYFDGSGSMLSNRWVDDCYLTASGVMMTNGYTPDGYYVGSDGKWQR